MSTDARTIELDECQKADVAEVADAIGKPWKEVIDEAIAAYRRRVATNGCEGDESVLEAATRLGVVGCVRSGVGDLSTNPAHMEGFGTDAP